MVMKRGSVGFVGLMMLCSSLQACGGSAPDNGVTTDQRLEVFNWWTNPGEADAFAALLKDYSQRYARTTVVNSAVATFSKAQEKLQGRMEMSDPPDTFQALGGWNLWKWVAYNGVDEV